MFFSYTVSVDKFSQVSLNLIISSVDITCFRSVTIFYIFQKKLLQKPQHVIEFDQ